MLRADQRDEFRRFVAGDDGMMRLWANQARKSTEAESGDGDRTPIPAGSLPSQQEG